MTFSFDNKRFSRAYMHLFEGLKQPIKINYDAMSSKDGLYLNDAFNYNIIWLKGVYNGPILNCVQCI